LTVNTVCPDAGAVPARATHERRNRASNSGRVLRTTYDIAEKGGGGSGGITGKHTCLCISSCVASARNRTRRGRSHSLRPSGCVLRSLSHFFERPKKRDAKNYHRCYLSALGSATRLSALRLALRLSHPPERARPGGTTREPMITVPWPESGARTNVPGVLANPAPKPHAPSPYRPFSTAGMRNAWRTAPEGPRRPGTRPHARPTKTYTHTNLHTYKPTVASPSAPPYLQTFIHSHIQTAFLPRKAGGERLCIDRPGSRPALLAPPPAFRP